MKRLKHVIKRKKDIKLRRRADNDTLKRRSRKAAIKKLKTRFSGGKTPDEMSYSQKAAVEKRIKKANRIVDNLSKRMLPQTRRTDRDRVNARSQVKKESVDYTLDEATLANVQKFVKKKLNANLSRSAHIARAILDYVRELDTGGDKEKHSTMSHISVLQHVAKDYDGITFRELKSLISDAMSAGVIDKKYSLAEESSYFTEKSEWIYIEKRRSPNENFTGTA